MGASAMTVSAAALPVTTPVASDAGETSDTCLVQVDGGVAEAFIAQKRIGERIKHLRLKKSMGLVELGRHTGLSASFLSQLETGRVVPTLRNLARISMVFSKDLSYFFESPPQTLFRVHRRKERVRMPQTGADDPAYYFESLGYLVPDRQLDPYFAEFVPIKTGRTPRPHQHPGCEFLYLLSGSLEVRHGETMHRIEAGDAVYFDAETTHSYICSGETPASALIVTLQHGAAVPQGNVLKTVAAVNGRVKSATPMVASRRAGGAASSSSSQSKYVEKNRPYWS